jgi:HEAT repeat protein
MRSFLSGGVLEAVGAVTAAFVLLCVGLAAVAVWLRWRNAAVARMWNRVEDAWEDQILEAMTGGVAVDEIILRLPERQRPYFMGFLSRFVQRVRGPERRQLLELARPLLPVLQDQLESRSAETRARAVHTLGLLSAPGQTQALVEALDDPSPLVAMVAARALTRERSPEHAGVIVRHLHRFESWRPSYLAAMLAAFGPEIGPALRDSLADRRQSSRVRLVSAAALNRLNDPAAAEAAYQVLLEEQDPGLLAEVLRLLRKVGHADHLPGIRARLDDPSEAVRLAAVRALGELGDPSDVPRLIGAMDDPSRWVVEHAARGLADGPGRATLLAMLEQPGPEAVIAREVLQEARA